MRKVEVSVSCIVPARNESGSLEELCREISGIDRIREVVIVEGGSSDDTWSVAQQLAKSQPNFIRAIQQDGRGKMNAVNRGMEVSTGDFIVIWDADGTVPASDVSKLIDLSIRESIFVKGDRLRGYMAPGAMRPINFLGNWFFALLWAPVLRERPSDVLCGSKVFPREVFESLEKDALIRDPYGDFALLHAATLSKCSVKSVEVTYFARSYGVTNISRWSGATKLFLFVMWMYRAKLFSRNMRR